MSEFSTSAGASSVWSARDIMVAGSPPNSRINQLDDVRIGSGYTPRAIVSILGRHRYLVLSCVAVITVMATLLAFALPQRFVATSIVILDTRRPEIVQQPAVLSNLVNGSLADPAIVRSEVALIGSPAYARRLIERLDLLHNKVFRRDIDPGALGAVWTGVTSYVQDGIGRFFGRASDVEPASDMGNAIEVIGEHLSVFNDEHSYAISIRYESRDPQFSRTIVNGLAELYTSDQLDAKRQVADRAAGWLKEQIGDLQQKLFVSEHKVAEFKIEHQLETVLTGNLAEQRMHELNVELLASADDLARKQANLTQIRALMASPGGAAAAAQVISSPLIQKLREQEADAAGHAASLKESFNAAYPLGQARLKEIELLIGDEVKRIASALAGEVAVAQDRHKAAEAALADEQAKLAAASLASVQLDQLQHNASTDRALYDSYILRYQQVQADEQSLQPGARVVQAERPVRPSFPNRLLFIGLGFFGSLFLGVMLAFIAEQMDETIRTPADAKRLTGVTNLGILPAVRNGRQALAAVTGAPLSAYSDAVANILVALRDGTSGQSPQVICVTSAVPGEGKTVIAASLARAAARSGKRTLLIDCDLRRPAIGRLFDRTTSSTRGTMFRNKPTGDFSKFLRIDLSSDLHYMPAESSPSSPQEILESKLMSDLIQWARDNYDLIVIDTPPLLIAADTIVLSRISDFTLLAIRWGHTPGSVVAEGLRLLQGQSEHPAATVLSMVNMRKYARYQHFVGSRTLLSYEHLAFSDAQ